MNKKFTLAIFLIIILSNFSKAYSIEADVFVQSTVNRAAKTLGGNLSKEERIVKLKEIQNQLKKDKTIAILGDMLELGKNSKRYHEALSCYIKDEAMIIGKEMKHLKNKKEEYKHYKEINEDFKKDLNKKLNNNKKETIGILIKGSVRMKMHQAVDYLKSLAL